VFAYLFLQCLPRVIRVLLFEDDPADMQAIADKVDQLIAMHVPQEHYACATVATAKDLDVSDLVAATQGARWKKFKLTAAKAFSSSRRDRGGDWMLIAAPRVSRTV
jgi:hypothetical protein